MAKLVIKLLKSNNVVVEASGTINVPVDDALINDIWKMEAAINEKGRVRVHISIEAE